MKLLKSSIYRATLSTVGGGSAGGGGPQIARLPPKNPAHKFFPFSKTHGAPQLSQIADTKKPPVRGGFLTLLVVFVV